MTELYEAALRLILAVTLGGIVGWQREAADKPAGFRTHILVCVGAALLCGVFVFLLWIFLYLFKLEVTSARVLVTAALAGHVSIATALARARRVGVAFALTVAVFGLARLEACEERSGFTATAQFEGEIKALGGRWARATTVDGFFSEVGELGVEVDSLAEAARDSARAAATDSAR